MSALVALLLASPASALTSQQGGPAFDLGVGLGLRNRPAPDGAPARPLGAAFAGQLSAGWWLGTYDDQYAFGKYWQLGATVRSDVGGVSGAAVTGLVEIRRGLELFVVGIAPFVAVGPTFAGPIDADPTWSTGLAARGGAELEFRRTRFWGFSLRLEAGADVFDAGVGFAGGALLGVSFSRPAHPITDPT